MLVDRVLAEDFAAPDLEFVWNEDRTLTADQAMAINTGYVAAGLKTRNEIRADKKIRINAKNLLRSYFVHGNIQEQYASNCARSSPEFAGFSFPSRAHLIRAPDKSNQVLLCKIMGSG